LIIYCNARGGLWRIAAANSPPQSPSYGVSFQGYRDHSKQIAFKKPRHLSIKVTALICHDFSGAKVRCRMFA